MTIIVAAVLHFEYFIYRAAVTVYTDHRPCTALLTSKNLNRRLRRYSLKLQSWDLDICYRPGKANGNADDLSRQDWHEDLSVESGVCDQIVPEVTILGGGDVGPASTNEKRGVEEKQDVKRDERR